MSYKNVALYPANPTTARGASTKLNASQGKIIYSNRETIIIRDLDNPTLSTVYNGHVQTTTVARISPSGYYCASADVVGNVRVWDIVGEDRVLKGEYKVLSGRISDLEWDGESKRIIAVGEGREKFGHAFMMDSGSSTGDITGHAKAINAVSIRHQRPFRAATASDDTTIVFHQGAPYKYLKSIKTHTKFIQDVRYAHSGDHFASVGSDAKIFIYDGKEGDVLKEFSDAQHKGTIMACNWSPDDRQLVTSSADCTVKLWDVQSGQAVTTWNLGAGVDNQQVGNTWSGVENIVSLSMSGDLNVFDARIGDKPTRVIKGPKDSVTALVPSGSDTFLAGTASGRIISYSVSKGDVSDLHGEGHSNLVTSFASASSGTIFSVGYDDKVREINGASFAPSSVSTSSQPKAVAITDDNAIVVAELNMIEVIKSNTKVFELPPKYNPTAIATAKSVVAVGGDDNCVHVYDWDGHVLKETGIMTGNKRAISALKFSPDLSLLASGDTSGCIILFDVKERKVVTSRWAYHSAKIDTLDWHSDNDHCASGSLDTDICVWSVKKPLRKIVIKNAAPRGVNAVSWVESPSTKLLSAGADGCVRAWEVTFHE